MDQFGVWGLITRTLVHTLMKTGGKKTFFNRPTKEGGCRGWGLWVEQRRKKIVLKEIPIQQFQICRF